jgi:uncharacterized damage-inducible protein DinB
MATISRTIGPIELKRGTIRMATSENRLPDERDDLLLILGELRDTLLITIRGINDVQALQRTTVSDLTLGGLIKHLTSGNRAWVQIMAERADEPSAGMIDMDQYYMREDETLSGLLEDYEAAARATEQAVLALPDLSKTVQFPHFPWSPPEPVRWSARHILLHLIRETAQHAGHADIIRESLDGANTTMQMAADLGMEI